VPTALKTKPGINGANVLSIPKDWDATWFRKFINNSLKGADVRNAVGANGIVVSGTIASPYATISIGGSGPVIIPGPVTVNGSLAVTGNLTVTGSSTLTAPVVINSTAGQTSLTVNGAAGQSTIRSVAGVGGDGLDITPSPSGNAIGISLGTATGFNAIAIANSNGDFIADILANGNFEMGTVGATQLSFYTSNGTRVVISPAGNVTIAAPSSGSALTVDGTSSGVACFVNIGAGAPLISSPGIAVVSPNGTQSSIAIAQSGAVSWYLYNPASTSDFRINNGTSDRITLTAVGAVNILAPSSTPAVFGEFSLNLGAPTTSGASNGLYVAAGTTSADNCAFFANAANSVGFVTIHGDGGVTIGNPTGGSKGPGTINVASGVFLNGTAYTNP
jgi:hypothetical protein